MEQYKEDAANRLLEMQVISEAQLAEIKAYRARGIFSLHNELQSLLYISILLFTGGAGVLIYKNIDTIGHTIILLVLLAVCMGCYYYCFKKSNGFSAEETDFDHPAFNYLVLLATILGCTFIGYLQFQYKPFGDYHEIPILLGALLALASAYYFDNRSALSIGITGLAATIGITITPKALLDNGFFENPALFYYGIALGLLLVVWAEYSERNNLKKHFGIIFLSFAQHLVGICCIVGLVGDYWPIYAVFLLAFGFYFYRKSCSIHSATLFVFVLIYGYIGFNIIMFKVLDWIGAYRFYEFMAILTPVYLIGSIFLFIRSIKRFNTRTNDSAQ